MGLIMAVVVGIFSGWLAGKIWKGKGFGLVGDLIIGILGGLLGNFLFGLVGIVALGLLGNIIAAVVGALILLWILRQIKK